MPLLDTNHPPAAVTLSPALQRLILHWGEMGSRWGVNRTVSQVHALLFLSARALDAEEIADTLMVARSNVSTSLRELAGWKLVRTVHRIGERRDRYETQHDPWELFRVIVRERKGREFDPTIAALRESLADAALARDDPAARARIVETLALMESLSSWSDEMLRLERTTLVKLMKLGAKVSALLQRAGAARRRARKDRD
jgi:DNA-binding transcriptional regulator GbsR (MarR family)